MEHVFIWTSNSPFCIRQMLMLFAFTQCLASEHYTIYRDIQVGSQKDSFLVPTSVCGLQAKCNSFKAKETNINCECSCGLNGGKRTTFGLYNGTWSCILDKDLRLREGCSLLISPERPDSAITVLPSNVQAKHAVNWNSFYCTIDENAARYQDCDGKWKLISNPTNKFKYDYAYPMGDYLQILEERNGQSFSHLEGKLIKLGLDCSHWASPGSYTKDCLLFKLNGTLSCPTIPQTAVTSIKPIETTSATIFTTPFFTQPTTAILFTSVQTKETTATTTGTAVATTTTTTAITTTASSTAMSAQLTREVVETEAIKTSKSLQNSTSSSTIKPVFPGNKDRRQDGRDESLFAAVMGGVAAAVTVLVVTFAAVIVVRRKRNERNNGSQRKKSSLHLSKTNWKSNESLISIQSDPSNCTNSDVFWDEMRNTECQTKSKSTTRTPQIPLHIRGENEEKDCRNIDDKSSEQKTFPIYAKVDKESKTRATNADQIENGSEHHSNEENPQCGYYASLQICQSYQCLTHQIQPLPSDEYAYAECDGSGSVQSESQDPAYYVLEGPDPNSNDIEGSCDIDKLRLANESAADLEHVYETPEGSEGDVCDEVYSTIDEIRIDVTKENSPQSPIYVELEGPVSDEVEI